MAVGRRHRAREYYTRLPDRIPDALERGQLRFAGFGILCHLHYKADPERQEVVTTVRGLADSLQWDRGREQFRRELGILKSSGWIDYDVRPGQRGPLVIRLQEAALLVAPEASSSLAVAAGEEVEASATQQLRDETLAQTPILGQSESAREHR